MNMAVVVTRSWLLLNRNRYRQPMTAPFGSRLEPHLHAARRLAACGDLCLAGEMKVDASKEVQALVRTLRAACAKLPGTEEYVMVHHPAFRVGKKPFAIAGMEEAAKGATLSINLGRDAQASLLEDPRFTRTPYIGQHGWVTISHAKLKKGELEELLLESFRRVAGKKLLAQLK
jgi:predicted DNA-binding protein (MmcQ/YjbR family)